MARRRRAVHDRSIGNPADAIPDTDGAPTMRTRSFILAAMLVAAVAAPTAQTYTLMQFPASALNLPDDAQIETSAELDGDPTTQEFILANYNFHPVRRAVLQLQQDGRVCTGPWDYWFGDDFHIWPTYITLQGITRVYWRNPYKNTWVITGLELPGCD